MKPHFRRLVRSLRKLNEELSRSAAKVPVYDDCPECGARLAFEFFDIPGKQTKTIECWKCEETIRISRTIPRS